MLCFSHFKVYLGSKTIPRMYFSLCIICAGAGIVQSLLVTARKRSLRRLCFYTCLSVILFMGSEGWYPSMPCRFPGPHSGGRLRGLAGGVSRPTPRGEVEGSGWGVSRPTLGDLQAHTWGVSRPTAGGGSGSPGPHP